MKRRVYRQRGESGEVMLESLIVYIITVFLLFFILALFSVLFQRWNIQTIAHEAAAKAAQTYRLSSADIVTGHLSQSQAADVPLYRYMFGGEDLKRAAENKAVPYIRDRLVRTTFTKSVEEPEISVAVRQDELSRRHIEVTITGAYTVPFGTALSYFGFDSIIRYSVTAYAQCLDMIDYINTVDFCSHEITLDRFGSGAVDLFNSVLQLLNKWFGK